MDNKKSFYQTGRVIAIILGVIGLIAAIIKVRFIGFYVDGSDFHIVLLLFIWAFAGIGVAMYFERQLKKIKEKEEDDLLNS